MSRTEIERTQDLFGLWPERLAADSAYGSAENLAWLVHERGIEPAKQRFQDIVRRPDPPGFFGVAQVPTAAVAANMSDLCRL